jgi:tetratricopeptide (TPR) repeat protein
MATAEGSGGDLAGFEARYASIARRLDGPEEDSAVERETVRAEIVGLFRDVETAIEGLTAFKERIRELVARYKALPAPAEGAAAGLAPAPPRADYLGSSTYMERGWTAIAAGEHERAVKELSRALELAPDDAAAATLLGWAQMLLGEHDEALFTYQKVLARDPANAIARVNLGYISLQKGIYGEAIEHLTRATREGGDRKAELYGTFYLGLVYSRREMYADARRFFRRALELGPNLMEAYWELGLAYYLDGNRTQAREVWEDGFARNRFNPWGERCGAALRRLEAGEPVAAG